MTLTTTAVSISYAGDGVSVAFAVPYNFFGPDEIAVYSIDSAGITTVLTRGTHYNVSGGNDATGTITATVAPAAGITWAIRRRTARTQQVDYIDYDAFPASTHEQALDRLTAQTQETDESINRAIRAPIGDAALAAMPTAANRASKYLGFDAAGLPVALAPVSSGIVSTAMLPVVGAATTDAALAALYYVDTGTGGTQRSEKSKWSDLVCSLTDFGADPTFTTACDTQFANFITAVMTTGRQGWIPPGRYKFNSAASIDFYLAAAAAGAATIRGVLNRSILDFTAVATVPALSIVFSAGTKTGFYGTIDGVSVRANCNGDAVRIGAADHSQAFNGYTFNLQISNSNTGAATTGLNCNGLFACNVYSTSNCNMVGDALRLSYTAFCNFYGSFGHCDNSIHITDYFNFGNVFHAIDHEVTNCCVRIDTANGSRNTWLGGQFSSVSGTAQVANIAASAGSGNRFIGINYGSGPMFAGSTGVIFGTVGTNLSAGTEYFGGVKVSPATGDGNILADAIAGQNTRTYYQSAGLNRWSNGKNNSAESGSNAGSDFVVTRYDDSAAAIDNPIAINRASGAVTLRTAVVGINGSTISFFGAGLQSKPTVTGAKGGNAALTSLLSALSTLGLVTDSSS